MYSEERLIHFQCPECGRWWTVGDAPIHEKKDWYCTWCGFGFVVDSESNDYETRADPDTDE